MKAFMDKDFLLTTPTARTLYHDCAAEMPIIDYHCHVSPMEIAQDRRFGTLTQVWLGGDHYKWRLIRANGTDEHYVTGNASDYEKFLAFARALPKAIGNPVYHWTHLELRRYFDCDIPLSPATAEEIWTLCNKKLADPGLSARGIITRSGVKVIATTDDPADTLEWHRAIRADKSFAAKVVPAFRPDRAVHIEKPDFAAYVKTLGAAAEVDIKTLNDLFAALENRIAFFDGMGCRTADHGLDYVPYLAGGATVAADAFKRAISGGAFMPEDAERYKTALMLFFGRQYAKRGWAMQLHYGAIRNTNTAMFSQIGPDTGYDAIGAGGRGARIAALLNHLEREGALPKTILYSLNPGDDAVLDAIAGCFPGAGVVGKVQHGSAWWFNDTKPGMEAHLTGLAARGMLGGFLGMLTDSRSFLSYTRHEYFRRILCNLIGNWVERGEYPCDPTTLGGMVKDISYRNAERYFGF